MKRTAIALVAFTSFGLGSFGVASFAQQGPRADGPAPTHWNRDAGERAAGDQRGAAWGMDHMQRLSPEDRAAFLDARIAAVHAGLKLSPEQDKLWAPAEQAFRDSVAKISAQMEQWRKDAKDSKGDDALTQLRHRAEAMALHAESMRKIADAVQPLYNSLSPEQKHRLPRLMGRHHSMMEHARAWMREHGMREHGMREHEMREHERPHKGEEMRPSQEK